MKRNVVLCIFFLLFFLIGCFIQLHRIEHEKINDTEGKLKTKIVFRLAETMPKGHPSARASEYFSRLVEDGSNGRIKVKVYYDGELGTSSEILEQIQFGGIALARINASDVVKEVTSLETYFKPQNHNASDELIKWLNKNESKIIDICQLERFTPLVWYYPDIRCFYSDEEKIQNLNDLKNKRVGIFSSSIIKNTMKSIGCSPVIIETSDIHRSLSAGFMDIGEASLSELYLSNYYCFIKYITINDFLLVPDVLVSSTDVFNNLEKCDRQLLKECAQNTYKFQKKAMQKFNEECIDSMKQDKSYVNSPVFNHELETVLKAGDTNDR